MEVGLVDMQISELLAQKRSVAIKHIGPQDPVWKMAEILGSENIGVLLVLDDDGAIAGVASERDIARAIATYRDKVADVPVSKVLTREVITCSTNDLVVETLRIMNEHNIRHIPVLEAGKPIAMVSIREFNLAYQKLQTQARTDHLTGLSNRRHFMDVLEQEISRHDRFGDPLTVAMLDLDRFKHVNDTYGHDIGDQVLCTLSKLLLRELRNYDGIGRLGGEEFAIIFPNVNLEDALVACNRLVAAIRNEVVMSDLGAVRFTSSFGVFETTRPGENARSILKSADRLLYKAKAEGRDRIASATSDTFICSDDELDPALAEAGDILPDANAA